MAHPYHEHKQHKVEHRRVAHITRGYAHGGAVHSDEAQDRKLIKKVLSERDAVAVEGKPARQRLDKPTRAKGGRVGKHKGTHVNVIVAPQGGAPSAPLAGVGPPAGPGPMPPRPPMLPPPQGMGGLPPGGPPPGIRHSGGRTYARGGAVKSGPAWKEGIRSGTPVQHTNNKMDGPNIGRGKPVTYAKGGPVEAPKARRGIMGGGGLEHPAKGGMAPKLPGGGGGGLARLAKARARHGSYRL